LFLMLCAFAGIAVWPPRQQAPKPCQYDWDRAI
jgi:hypothetical protein